MSLQVELDNLSLSCEKSEESSLSVSLQEYMIVVDLTESILKATIFYFRQGLGWYFIPILLSSTFIIILKKHARLFVIENYLVISFHVLLNNRDIVTCVVLKDNIIVMIQHCLYNC